MEKYTFQKTWYKSQRLRVALVAIVLLIANDMFGLGLPENTVELIVGVAMTFIAGKSIQDALASHAEVKAKAIAEAVKKDPSQP